MSWMWMNLPLAVVFVGAIAGIPLFLVLTNPTFSTQPADTTARTPARQHTGAAAGQILRPADALVDAAS